MESTTNISTNLKPPSSNSNNGKLQLEVIEKVKQSLKCQMPLCERFPRPNEDTYRCGACFRITCQVCYISNGGQLKSCTCTNATLQSDPIVKLFISAFNYYPCKYHYNGCTTEPLTESLGSHEDSCEYRFIECPKLTCRWKFPMQKGLMKHFEVVHPKSELVSSKDHLKYEGSLEKLLDQLHVLIVQEKECFPYFSRKDNSLMVWIIMLGNNEDTLPYRLSLTFKTGPDTVQFTGKIYSTDRPKSEFVSGRHGIAIPLDSIMEYFDSRKKRYVKLDKISFNLTITNILLKDNSGKSDPESGVEDID